MTDRLIFFPFPQSARTNPSFPNSFPEHFPEITWFQSIPIGGTWIQWTALVIQNGRCANKHGKDNKGNHACLI